MLGFALVNNIIPDPQAYLRRMRYWHGPEITSYSLPPGLGSQVKLLGATALDLYFALGWPLLLLVSGSLVYGLMKMPGKAAFCVLPLLSYQFIVIAAIRFTMPRFFMPGSPYPPNAGFHNFAYPWKPPPDPAAVSPAALPPYVISGSSWQMSRAANRFVNAMGEGTLPYRKAATLRQRLFYPNKTPFGFAGWPVVRQRQSSPEITIWARSDL